MKPTTLIKDIPIDTPISPCTYTPCVRVLPVVTKGYTSYCFNYTSNDDYYCIWLGPELLDNSIQEVIAYHRLGILIIDALLDTHVSLFVNYLEKLIQDETN